MNTTQTQHTPTQADLSFLRRYSNEKGGLVPLDNLLESHASLVAENKRLREALEALTSYVDSYKWGSAWAGRPHKLCDSARAALSTEGRT